MRTEEQIHVMRVDGDSSMTVRYELLAMQSRGRKAIHNAVV
jgi:hypothetical protein